MKVLTFALVFVTSLLFAVAKDPSNGYAKTLMDAAKVLQLQNSSPNKMTGDFILKSMLSSIFPQMNDNGLSGILQSINRLIYSLPKTNETIDMSKRNETNDINNILKSLMSLPVFNDISSTFGNNLNFTVLADSMFENRTNSRPVSSSCESDLRLFISGLLSRNEWALRMLDAFGKPESGILDGAIRWLGNYDECVRINSDIQAPFNGKYCMLSVPVNIPKLSLAQGGGIGVGVCLPKSCSVNDATNAVNSLLASVRYSITFTSCQEDKEYDTRAIVVLCVCGFFVALMIFATILDVFFVLPKIKQTKAQNSKKKSSLEAKVNEVEKSIEVPENGTANCGPVDLQFVDTRTADSKQRDSVWFSYKPNTVNCNQDNSKTPRYNPGLCVKLILSFSVYSNGKKLLNTKQTGGTLGAVNGVRFISMTWVMLGHSISFGMAEIKNIGYLLPTDLRRWTFMAISNALLSVDSFFTLSGLLLSYLFLKEMKRQKGRINWFMFYFHRFWRLTPAYMLVMMVHIALTKYFGNGPNYPADGFEKDYCRHTWWRNLIYVNNFFPGAEMCFGWAWYLANDMQFYVISPLILVPLYYSKKLGGLVFTAFLLGVTAATIAVSAVLELPSTIVTVDNKVQDNTDFDYYYVRPYCRMGPYLMGIITGYVLYKTECKVNMRKIVNLSGWLMAFTFGCIVLYGTYEDSIGNPMSIPIAAIYNATSRTVWGACVCWVIFSCCTGHGGFVNSFLSWKLFIPLARLTYCAYLVHPIIMFAYFGSLKETRYTNNITLSYDFLANTMISYAVAFVTSLAFEAPMMGLEKAIFRRGK